MARGASSWLIRVGKEEAKKVPKHKIVADTLCFLAKPGRTKASISRKAAALLDVWNATPAMSDAFHESEISEFEFVEALEGAVRGELVACRRVTEVAAALAPDLRVRRGPKVSEASITHHLLLTYVANTLGPKSHTYNAHREDFTDLLTRATRAAFDKPKFDPRPAFRQYRARRQQKANLRSPFARLDSKSPQLVPLSSEPPTSHDHNFASWRTAMGVAKISRHRRFARRRKCLSWNGRRSPTFVPILKTQGHIQKSESNRSPPATAGSGS
jgi:hypothetical protein